MSSEKWFSSITLCDYIYKRDVSLLIGLLIGSIIFQIILALFTAKDAHSRGHDRILWFVAVFIFGIFSIIIYLLTRNDSRLPESDRPDKRNLKSYGRNVGYYSAFSFAGLILFFILGSVIAPSVYPEPETNCETETISIGGQEAAGVSCEDPDNYDAGTENREKRFNFSVIFGLVGFTSFPLGLYYRNLK